MKKFLTLLLALVLVAPALPGCSGGDKVEIPEEIPEESSRGEELDAEEDATEAPPPPGAEEGEGEDG